MPEKDFEKKLADIAEETNHGKDFEELDKVEKELNLDDKDDDDAPKEGKDKDGISELLPPIPPITVEMVFRIKKDDSVYDSFKYGINT